MSAQDTPAAGTVQGGVVRSFDTRSLDACTFDGQAAGTVQGLGAAGRTGLAPTSEIGLVGETRGVHVLNPDAPEIVDRPLSGVYVHDLRARRGNLTIARDIATCRHKLDAAPVQCIRFAEEALCLTRRGYFELRLARTRDTLLGIGGAPFKIGHRLGGDAARLPTWRPPEPVPATHLEGRSFVSLGIGRPLNFYHWMGEQLPRLALLARHVDPATIDHVAVLVRTPQRFVQDTVALLLPAFADKIRQIDAAAVTCREALFFVPRHIAEARAGAPLAKDPPDTRKGWGSLIALKETIDAAAGRLYEPGDWPEVLVVSRARTGGRAWLNEAVLVARLAAVSGRPVRVIHAEDHPIRAQINFFHHARVVIAQHGAGLANAIFCRPDATVIEVTGRSHAKRAADFAKLAVARGHEHHVVVVDAMLDADFAEIPEPDAPVLSYYASDIHASDDALDFVVDLTARRARARAEQRSTAGAT